MNVFCLKEFKTEFEKLKRKRSYSSIEGDIIEYFFKCKNIKEISSGIRLNGASETPYIKKRLCGRGGFRVYFLLIVKKETIYLMFIHPKTGSLGADNISDKMKSELYSKVTNCIKINEDLYTISLNNDGDGLIFKEFSK